MKAVLFSPEVRNQQEKGSKRKKKRKITNLARAEQKVNVDMGGQGFFHRESGFEGDEGVVCSGRWG